MMMCLLPILALQPQTSRVFFSHFFLYKGSSGIREIETDTFKLHCHQTLTGVKFVVVADRNQVIFFCCDFEERKNTAFFRF